MKPSIGRTVHFVDGAGVHYAAIVTWVWSSSCVNLSVLPNGVTPLGGDLPVLRTSVPYVDPAIAGAVTEHTWHWPEREPERTDHEIAVAAARTAGL